MLKRQVHPFPERVLSQPHGGCPWAEEFQTARLLGMNATGEEPSRVRWLPQRQIGSQIFFLGDLHGDILALEAILEVIAEISAGHAPTIVFLGDLIDRGPASLLVVRRILAESRRRPDDIAVIAGDHEEALHFREERPHFSSSVQPGETAVELNAAGESALCFGRGLCGLLRRLPIALFLGENGELLAAHGGIPHQDLLSGLHDFSDLEAEECREDFLWNRLTDAPRKRPNRLRSGADFGTENLDEFFACVSKLRTTEGSFAQPRWLLCGHQHPANGAMWVPTPGGAAALCLNSSFFREPLPGLPEYGAPTFAEWLPDREELDLHALEVPETAVRDFYRKFAAGEGRT